uniref:Factor VIII intron 22 protein n=3 Tax=Parascaris TaxID=6254 RepID=A0A914ZEJ0_PARUN
MSETYHDPWQDYKAILESLKKKFLKKPNYAQALLEFSNLALRFEDEECEHYAAMCNYQMSKIYEGLGDWSLQYSRLLKAARLFRDAEIKTHDMCSLGCSDSLNHMQDCYNKACKVILDHNGVWLAGLHSTELASTLCRLDKPELALKYFIRGARLLEVELMSRLAALKKLAECQSRLGLYSDALITIDELWTTHMKNSSDDPKFGPGKELLKDCEIACVLLLLRTKCGDMSPRHRLLLGMYVDEVATSSDGQERWQLEKPSAPPIRREFPAKDSVLNMEQFISLYDFVRALRIGNIRIAKKSFIRLEPFLDELCSNLAADMLSIVVHKGRL